MKQRNPLPKTRGKSRPGESLRRREETELQHGGFRSSSTDDDVEDFGEAREEPDDKLSILEKREKVRGSLALAIIVLSVLALIAGTSIDLYRGVWQSVVYVAAVVVPFLSAVVYFYFRKQ